MSNPRKKTDHYPATFPAAAAFREFHSLIPLEGSTANNLLSLPDDHFLYLAAAIRNEPVAAPLVSLEDWHRLLDYLKPHGITSLIAWHLASWPEDCRPPGEIMELLSRVLLSAGARSLRLGRQIRIIIRALDNAGIPVLLLKGPALARTVYPDPALRQSFDIDLLVKPEDVLRCESIFTLLGYTCYQHTYRIAPHDQHHQQFFPPDNGSTVELHWVTDSNYRMFCPGWLNDAFDRKIPVSAEDLSCFTLHPVDHLTFLAFHHVFQHQALRLDWIGDLAFIRNALTAPDDWEELRSSCVLNHIRIPLELALTAGILWMNDDMPPEFRDFSAWPEASERELKLWMHAAKRRTSLRSDVSLRLQAMTSFSEKLRFCARFIVPPRELMHPYRKSESPIDLPLAYIRRWLLVTNYHL